MDIPGKLIAVIGDEDTVTGFVLAGVGHRTAGTGENFLVVKGDTEIEQIEKAFDTLTTRPDVGILLINQHVANMIRHKLRDYTATIPTILEIPSKDHPYDPEMDSVMQRVRIPDTIHLPGARTCICIVSYSNSYLSFEFPLLRAGDHDDGRGTVRRQKRHQESSAQGCGGYRYAGI